MAKTINNLKSTCCNAVAKVEMTSDFIGDNPKTMRVGTCHYICTKCQEVCDVYLKQRKTWTRNPKTQIIGDKRAKKEKKLTKKEIEEFRRNEDF